MERVESPLPIVWTPYRAGRHILDEGAPNTGAHIVCSGLIMATYFNEGGSESVVHLLGTGGIADATDVLLENPTYSLSARALTDTIIGFVRPDILSKHLENDASFMRKLLGQVITQMRSLEKRCRSLLSLDATGRVVYALLQLAQILRPKDAGRVPLPLPLERSVLAQLAATTPETTSRVVVRLLKSRLILQSNRHVTIPDIQRLREAFQAYHLL
ncbi:MAG: Crp/Fnr family transcriptional regulator [Nitrospirae bacterium]|nr:Crp/Fnr family transcriptional regulator [Nitrospirota bacterium]